MTDPSSFVPTALVIDDNWYNRDIFRIALENAGYRVTAAESGQNGLDLLAQQLFDLLVLDLQMPGIDGREVLNIVRSQPKHCKMRVIVVTANPHMATDKVDNLADHVMHKPIDVVSFSQFTKRLKASYTQRGPTDGA
jgi:CheY-like chemotaxis protein